MQTPASEPQQKTLPQTELCDESPLQSEEYVQTRFFGREEELARLKELLRPVGNPGAPRLITLTGTGGSGKTRLAVEALRQAADAFAGSAWFVPLADLTDTRLIADVVAHHLELPRFAAHPLEDIVSYLNRQPALLILDNLEHLISPLLPDYQLGADTTPDGAAFVWKLLTRVPKLILLVTSRVVLELGGEQEFPLRPLPVPEGHREHGTETLTPEQVLTFPGVQLFVDRAQSSRPDFEVTPHNVADVAALCARLEGIPLALELAAARAHTFPPAEMLAQLEQRFDFLVSQKQELPERHRTLYSAIEWSYHNLPPELSRFFARLSVFRGGCTVATAEAVALPEEESEREGDAFELPPDALDCLTQLQAHSLLSARPSGGTMRFSMLETVREFTEGQLTGTEREAVQRRHTETFLALVDAASPHLTGAEQATWLARLDAELDNLRAVLDRFIQHGREARPETQQSAEGEAFLWMTIQLDRFWRTRGLAREGRHYYEAALAHPGAQDPTSLRARAWNILGLLAWMQGDLDAAYAAHEESLTIRRVLNDPIGISSSLHNMSSVLRDRREYAAASEYAQQALDLIRDTDETGQKAVIFNTLGLLAVARKDYPAAHVYYEECLRLRREVGDTRGIAIALYNLGEAASHQAEDAAARRYYEESLRLCQQLGEKVGLLCALEAFAFLAMRHDQPVRTVRLFFAADRFRGGLGLPLAPADRQDWEPTLAEARAALGANDFETALQESQALTLEEAIALALEEASSAGSRNGLCLD
jgi:predicted ATPase